MENTNTRGKPTDKQDSLRNQLDDYLEKKRVKDEAVHNKELLTRAAQVRVLQGLTMQCGIVKCPKCGTNIVDPRPTATDDDEFTRL